MFLGSRADMEDIARAFAKIHEHRGALHDWCRRGQGQRTKGAR